MLKTTGSYKEDAEIKRNVEIGIIPLRWISRDGAELSKLYRFFKTHDLHESIL